MRDITVCVKEKNDHLEFENLAWLTHPKKKIIIRYFSMGKTKTQKEAKENIKNYFPEKILDNNLIENINNSTLYLIH